MSRLFGGLVGAIGLLPNPSSIVRLVLDALTGWIASGASYFLDALGSMLSTGTDGSFAQSFSSEFTVMEHIGALFCALFLGLCIIQAILRQDFSVLWRGVFLRLPMALLFGWVATEIVQLALQATDALSAAVLATAPTHALVTEIASALALTIAADPSFGGVAGFVLAGLAVVVTLTLYFELVLRSAAIAVATLFIPLGLAGAIWPATAHWARRLGETIAALVLSKLVIATVLALAASSLSVGTGVFSVVEGIALLFLAAVAPLALIRLVPMVEAGAIAHLEGLDRRMTMPLQETGLQALERTWGIERLGEQQSGTAGIPFATGAMLQGPEYEEAVAQVTALLEESRGDGRANDRPATSWPSPKEAEHPEDAAQ